MPRQLANVKLLVIDGYQAIASSVERHLSRFYPSRAPRHSVVLRDHSV
jgi:hypothetical protein